MVNPMMMNPTMMMNTPMIDIKNMMYELPDGRVWSTKEAKFVGADVINQWKAETGTQKIQASPVDKNGNHTIEGLHDALVFYKLPLGELATTEERFEMLRAKRDELIEKTDYLVNVDYPLTDAKKQKVFAYRQALRDLPSQAGAPWDGGGDETPWPVLDY